MADSARWTDRSDSSQPDRSVAARRTDGPDDGCDMELIAAMSALRGDHERRMEQLVSTIESEIIPRLLLANRVTAPQVQSDLLQDDQQGVEQIDEFARLLLAHDVSVASTYLETVKARGTSQEAIYLELLAPAARRLGELWTDDRCTFSEVTVGLCRLHQLLRDMSPGFGGDAVEDVSRRRVLLAPTPGEQHTFGLLMVADFFRRDGWDVWSEITGSVDDLVDIVSSEWFSLVGLSLGSEVRLDTLSSSIHAIRKASRNKSLGVMVGGATVPAPTGTGDPDWRRCNSPRRPSRPRTGRQRGQHANLSNLKVFVRGRKATDRGQDCNSSEAVQYPPQVLRRSRH